jgi:hypothetical protein
VEALNETLKSVRSSISIVGMIISIWYVSTVIDGCIARDKCKQDCAAIVPQLGQSRSNSIKSRCNDKECWCFDTKTGETRRLW